MNKYFNLQFFAEGDPAPISGEKTFSQDDVNRIVGERLAKEKAKYEADSQVAFKSKQEELTKREQELQFREFKSKARESLSEKGLPNELLEVINYSNEDEMNKSIGILEKAYQTKNSPMIVGGFRPTNPGTQTRTKEPFLQGLGEK